MDFLLVLLAYLIGSINFPILAGRLRGWDIREHDLAGTSGVFRQLGSGWGVGVGVLEVGKGMLAAWLAGLSASFWAAPLCALAVVAGHIWPVWFGFRGGGAWRPQGATRSGPSPRKPFGACWFLRWGWGSIFCFSSETAFKGLALSRLRPSWLLFIWFMFWGQMPEPSTPCLRWGGMALRGVLVLTGRWWHR